MMKILYAFLLLCCSCHHEIDHGDLAVTAMRSYAKQVRKEFGFELSAFGGCMMNDIEIFEVTFARNDKVTVDEARRLIVQISEGFIAKINADEKIRPYLHNYPITQKNVRFHLSFAATRAEPPGNSFVYYVSSTNGKIFYDSFDNSIPRDDQQIVSLANEPYDEALKILHREN